MYPQTSETTRRLQWPGTAERTVFLAFPLPLFPPTHLARTISVKVLLFDDTHRFLEGLIFIEEALSNDELVQNAHKSYFIVHFLFASYKLWNVKCGASAEE